MASIWRALLGLSGARTPAAYPSRPAATWDSAAMRAFGFPQPASTTVADPTAWTVSGEAAAAACLFLISDTCGSLPMFAYTRDADGSEARLDPTPDILRDPFPLMPVQNWTSAIVQSMILRGNAYALPADPDPATGYPRQLPLLNPDSVWVHVDESTGLPVYDVEGVPFGPGEIVHFPGIQPPGSPVGIGVIERHRQQLLTSGALESYALQSFTTAGVPSGVVTVDRPELGKEQADDLKARWMAAFSGVREPAVVPRSITFQPLSFSPTDMSYINARQQNTTEICWMFGVHPNMIGAPAGSSMTYANVEAANSAFAWRSLMPWTGRIEQVLSKWTPRGLAVRFEYGGLLRGTTAERYASHAIALDKGFLTLNEVRDLEHLPRFPEEQEAPAASGLVVVEEAS